MDIIIFVHRAIKICRITFIVSTSFKNNLFIDSITINDWTGGIEKIGDKGLKEATGKGKDTFLKKSNPEHPGRHIDLKDAVDLDIYCRKNGFGTPLLESYKTILDKATGISSNYKPDEIRQTVTKILEELGDVSETVSSAIKDGKVTETEKNKISKEIKELEIQISTIKKQVGLGEKHDYKYKTGEKIKNRDEDGLKSD